MRRFLLAAVMFGAAFSAQAADMPDFLRGSLSAGPAPRVNWQGYYIGGQAAYGSSDENFNGSTSNLVAPLIANNVIQQMGVADWNLQLGKQSGRAPGYGAFAGYNSQWDDVVIGLEASYLHGKFGGKASANQALIGGPLTDGNYHAVSVTSQSEISITDMATFRGRAGYAYGSFLPYLFGGLALGNADITRSVSIKDNYSPTFAGALASCSSGAPPLVCASYGSTQGVHNHLIYGYTAGLGFDVNLIGGLFMRAEWEYIRFSSQVDTSINTVRAGLGYKF
jgi:outer membrane immunogenic protein